MKEASKISEASPQWVAGNPRESEIFGRARECAGLAGKAQHSKILWAGNSAIFWVATALTDVDLAAGSSLAEHFAQAPFSWTCAAIAGACFMHAFNRHQVHSQAERATRALLDPVRTEAAKIIPSAVKAEPGGITEATLYTLFKLAEIQAVRKQAQARGPKP